MSRPAFNLVRSSAGVLMHRNSDGQLIPADLCCCVTRGAGYCPIDLHNPLLIAKFRAAGLKVEIPAEPKLSAERYAQNWRMAEAKSDLLF